ncbi:hypothetical protein BH11CYA1_BH11CYA1_42890 [soil metagenome]
MKQTIVEPSKSLSWVFIVCFCIANLYFGFICGQIALTDPDTCWLVALGQEITKRGNIPSVDPFSWTLTSQLSDNQPYIAYQWLSAIIFATTFKIGGATALLYFTALSIITSFVVVPLAASKILRISPLFVASAACIGISAGSFHFPCRPEIFSYLLLALLIAATVKLSESKGKLPFFAYGIFSALFFALWANLHTGFVIGLAVLAVTSLFIPRVPLLASLLGGLAGSLVTPYAAKLWQYLPHLFFSQANKYNQELFPLTSFELLSFDFLAFDMLGIAIIVGFATDIVIQIKQKKEQKKFSQETFNHLPWLLLAAAGWVIALESRRMVPFAALLAMGFVYQFLITHRQKLGFFDWPSIKTKYLLIPLLLATFGVHTAISIFHAALPNSTFGFIVPTNALAVIEEAKPKGRLLNDPQYGDLLVLASGEKAQVFIDTRFDVYGDKITLDFWNMANCRGPWQKLLEQYQIDWVFFPSRAPLVNRLAKDSGWKTLFKDDDATILIKR